MVENNKDTRLLKHYELVGIAFGFGIGLLLGMLPLMGNLGWLLGGMIGSVFGLVVSGHAKSLGGFPIYTILGIAAGAAACAGLILAMNRFLLIQWQAGLGLWFGAAAGINIGSTMDLRRKTSGG